MLATEHLSRIVDLTSVTVGRTETITPVPVAPDRHIIKPVAE
jgi:hypothetical protein